MKWVNQSAASDRRSPGHSEDLDNLSAIIAADRAFPAAVAALGRSYRYFPSPEVSTNRRNPVSHSRTPAIKSSIGVLSSPLDY
jgi:hypothetical protein